MTGSGLRIITNTCPQEKNEPTAIVSKSRRSIPNSNLSKAPRKMMDVGPPTRDQEPRITDVSMRIIRLASTRSPQDERDFLTHHCVKSCGGTQAEALSKGCLYDHIENRFTRPDCVNALLNDEFSKLGPGPNGSWIYRVDVHGNGMLQDMDAAEMLANVKPGLKVWQVGRQHMLHCIFVWRRNALSHFDGTIITMERQELFEHDAHCGRMLANRMAGDDLDRLNDYALETEL
ncbi:hypothetical protein PTMSG1_10546 [Pyrenophora teres f. maculata]|nr:hypothetical protein PTMSG1_10546 [Pyrenophora teres f. maculata]